MKIFKKKEKISKKTLDKYRKQCIISRESLNERRQISRRFIIMSKKEFVEAYAKATGETKKRAEELVNEFLGTVEGALVKGETVQFVGWGTFGVQKRAARTGRNPQTGKEIKIAAKKVVKFKVGKKLADKVAASKKQLQLTESEKDYQIRFDLF